MIADSDCVRGHIEELGGAESSAPILSEEEYMQRKLDLAGRGVRLRGASPVGMLMDHRHAQGGTERSTTSSSDERRPAA